MVRRTPLQGETPASAQARPPRRAWAGGFRVRLQLALIGVCLLTALLIGGLGAWQFRSALERAAAAELERHARLFAPAVLVEGGEARLDPDRLGDLPTHGEDRFRVVKGGQVFVEVGGRWPEDLSGWLTRREPLEGGFVLEAAHDGRVQAEALRAFWQTGLLALPLALGLAVGVSYLLFGPLFAPVRRLIGATHLVAQQRFPEPLPVPAGDDELSDLARSFNRMTEAVQGFLERERSFARYTSHELRTPLATLRVQVEALEQGLLPKEESLPAIKASLGRLERILAGLLSLTRAPQTEPGPVPLGPVLRGVVEALPPSERGRVRLEGDLDALAHGYDGLLQQALANLAHNALKFGNGPVVVEVQGGAETRVRVRDDGPGVPEAMLGRLGEPFLRLQTRVEGTGLGLALVRHVASLHQGRLEFRNRPEGGLEALLALPSAGVGRG